MAAETLPGLVTYYQMLIYCSNSLLINLLAKALKTVHSIFIQKKKRQQASTLMVLQNGI